MGLRSFIGVAEGCPLACDHMVFERFIICTRTPIMISQVVSVLRFISLPLMFQRPGSTLVQDLALRSENNIIDDRLDQRVAKAPLAPFVGLDQHTSIFQDHQVIFNIFLLRNHLQEIRIKSLADHRGGL